MREGAAFRGQPLLLLAALVFGWLALRAVLWQPPLEPLPPRQVASVQPALHELAAAPAAMNAPATAQPTYSVTAHPMWTVAPPLEPVIRPASDGLLASPPLPMVAVPSSTPRLPVRAAIGHNLLLVAGLAQMELPPALLAYLEGAQPLRPGIPAAAPMLAATPQRPSRSRWSADSWLLLRDDEVTPILSGRPSYGRSQVGAVVRYSLARSSGHRPQVYLRGSMALSGEQEQELAAGISARPLARLPLRLAVEGRVGETDAGTRARAAAFAVTEFPPLRLPLGMRGEVYAQAGYVTGAYATAFADGQARIERPLARRGELELNAGAGVWGGAQRDAARLDVGPSATASFRLGPAYGRVAADYRFRVAGEAEPASGPALTVSAGF